MRLCMTRNTGLKSSTYFFKYNVRGCVSIIEKYLSWNEFDQIFKLAIQDSSSAELNRRMEFLDQSFRTHNSRYLMNIDYSPPPSPATSSQQHQVIHSHLMGNLMNPASDPHINVDPNSQSNSGSVRGISSSVSSRIPEHPALRHNALLMRLHQGHLAAASSQHSGKPRRLECPCVWWITKVS